LRSSWPWTTISPPGQHVELPRALATHVMPRDSSSSVSARSLLRVLVVEGDAVHRWLIAEHLREAGVVDIVEASDGGDALASFAANPFDVVVTELLLQGMDGLRFLRSLPVPSRKCGIIIASAMGGDLLALVERALSESGRRLLGVLPKPVDQERLSELLDRAIVSPTSIAPPPAPRPRVTVTPEDLALALVESSFVPFFQPKLDIATGEVTTVEALARWNHPEKGWIPPSEFIPLLERDGSIGDLTTIMLQKVCASLKRFEEAGVTLKAAVNLSRTMFHGSSLVEDLASVVAEAGLHPDRIILEITETAVERDPGEMLTSLARLKLKGFRLSIDDFGTGYSSMLALTRVPFDELKIDRSFVTGATRDRRSRIIMESTIELASKLGQITVAEGVETHDELEVLRSARCDQVQGYLFARPLAEDALSRWLSERPPDSVDPRRR
jgi:EAL domain-containing protein (putative c-di-GMP-specific phosphodiesterase class I)